MTSQPAALDRWIGFSPKRPAVRRNRMHFTPAGYARLSDKQRARVEEALCRGDLYGEVGGAWAVKEQLRLVYDADTPEVARHRIDTLYELARNTGTPEVLRLATTIKRWEPQVLA